jgi:glycosyltransferase involved in cell wall biosynthesis
VDVEEIVSSEAPFDLRQRLGLGRDAFVAGTVGALFEVKHHERIVDAAASDSVAWIIIGEGPRRPFLEQRIRERGAHGRVHLTGALLDARAHIRAFDVFVFPSIGEALGTSVLDAMALGVPVVAADSAGPAEVLAPVHERTGNTLHPPDDAAGLAAAVERFRLDPALRERAIAAQRERVLDYTIERTAERVLALYREVLA